MRFKNTMIKKICKMWQFFDKDTIEVDGEVVFNILYMF